VADSFDLGLVKIGLILSCQMNFSNDEDFAKQLDAEDPLRSFRDKFHLPRGKDGKPLIYFAGNSLGLMPKSAREFVDQELDDWAKLGVDAHLEAKTRNAAARESVTVPSKSMGFVTNSKPGAGGGHAQYERLRGESSDVCRSVMSAFSKRMDKTSWTTCSIAQAPIYECTVNSFSA
jgi:hypothetical protein